MQQWPEAFKNLQQFWSLELIGIKPEEDSNLTKEESEAQQLQDRVTHYNPNSKTWFTSLLFKDPMPDLGTNKAKAIGILKKVEQSAIKQGQVDNLNKCFEELVANGFAEEVTEDTEPPEVHYIPAHAVYRDDSITTKIRIVFNASAKTETGISLNECLFQGPCLLPDIVQVLIRFRLNLIAFISDISKMFLRIKLDHGQDFLRFLWRNCETTEKIRIFRMLVVTFGVISSPFQASDVVLKHAELFEPQYPHVGTLIREQLYMDDLPGGANTKEEAEQLIKNTVEFFLHANMQPHKMASNFPEILKSFDDKFKNPEKTIKVLGVSWDTSADTIMLNVKSPASQTQHDTKRSFLEVSAKIYDPLGLLAPFTMRIKLLFQQVWIAEKEQTDKKKLWDNPLPHTIQAAWNELKEDFPKMNDISVQRCFFTQHGVPDFVEIFAFGDASIKAYATAIYLVGHHKNGQKSANLVLSKTRVAPLKMGSKTDGSQTIVRLELLAALITARATDHVLKSLQNKVHVKEVHYFTDSQINLWRIRRGPNKFQLWVANRLSEILTLTSRDQWRHCPGAQNPADLPSRGLTAFELKACALWWFGPEFILLPESNWPPSIEMTIPDDPELKKSQETDLDPSIFVLATGQADRKPTPNWEFIDTLINRFDDWQKTIKLLAFILRMANPQHKKFAKQPISLEETNKVENLLWQWSQQRHLTEEFERLSQNKPISFKSKLLQYNPYWSVEDGLLRSNTRLILSNLPESTRKAIILPKNCSIVEKFIMKQHRVHQHAGSSYLHALIKDNFLLQQSRRQIRKIIRKCTKRGCATPVPLTQQESPLPANRIDNCEPFRHAACDLFGPMTVFHKCGLKDCPHPKESKVHGALFTCFHSRAVHLELVDDASTEAFMNAFRAFCARRGTPSTMYSDNAKNFKAASKEIRRLYASINWNTVKKKGLELQIEWYFSTERAPHQNGLCERLVRTVKKPLRVAIGAAQLTRNQLALILTEIEAVVNNRPLATPSEDPADLTPITPMELICGRRLTQIPDPKAPNKTTNIAHLWRKRQAILNQFWQRWHNDYLLEQSVRKIWRQPSNQDLLDKIVLVRDDHLSRNEWKIGRIISTFPSKDGLTRNVEVQTATSKLRRPVQKLALLENV